MSKCLLFREVRRKGVNGNSRQNLGLRELGGECTLLLHSPKGFVRDLGLGLYWETGDGSSDP